MSSFHLQIIYNYGSVADTLYTLNNNWLHEMYYIIPNKPVHKFFQVTLTFLIFEKFITKPQIKIHLVHWKA